MISVFIRIQKKAKSDLKPEECGGREPRWGRSATGKNDALCSMDCVVGLMMAKQRDS
jgi:hypothetical protein